MDDDALKQALRARENAVRLTDSLVQTVPPLLILGGDLRVKRASRSFCEAFGAAPTETEGRSIFEVGGGRWDLPQLRKLLEEVIPKEKAFDDFEIEHDPGGPAPRTLLLRARELDGDDPSDRTILLSIQDVSAYKLAERRISQLNDLERQIRQRTAELEISNEELEAFCYSLAHDLRNPLRGIEGFSRLLIKQHAQALAAGGVGYCERIRSAALRMASLIDSLLDLARLTRAEMRRDEIDLSLLGQLIADGLKKKEPGRNVDFVIGVGLKHVGDDRLMTIALAKLFENAWKFTSKHPCAKIEFGLVKKEEEWTFFVRDDGAGFDMAYAEKLFQTFQRLHAPDEFPGTGIGLTIAQRIIRRHGGRIWAEGEVERGATFYFSLPPPDRVSTVPSPVERRQNSRPKLGCL